MFVCGAQSQMGSIRLGLECLLQDMDPSQDNELAISFQTLQSIQDITDQEVGGTTSQLPSCRVLLFVVA